MYIIELLYIILCKLAPSGCSFLSSLPAGARIHLELQLDSDNEGIEKDLFEIAQHMLEWEDKLCVHLGLTKVDIHDIKAMYSGNPSLQR